jgi:hypothetical protein
VARTPGRVSQNNINATADTPTTPSTSSAKPNTHGVADTIEDEPPSPPSTKERADTCYSHDCRQAEEAYGHWNSCAEKLLMFFRLDTPHGIQERAWQK